jgi:hypothetical protein
MQRITLEEFRDFIQGSTGPIVDGILIPIVDGQALRIHSGLQGGFQASADMSFWLWTEDDFDTYKEELNDAHGIKEKQMTNKIDEMWAALAAYQPQADAQGHGASWAKMCSERTSDAAADAAYAYITTAAYVAATDDYTYDAEKCMIETIARINALLKKT